MSYWIAHMLAYGVLLAGLLSGNPVQIAAGLALFAVR